MQSISVPTLARSQPLTVPLSRYGATLAQTPFTLQPEPDLPISFRYGRPALTDFPLKLWRKLLSRRCCADPSWLDYATDFQGYLPLRQAIAQYLCRSRAVRCQPDQIVITNGTQQGLDLILRLLIETGDAIAIEEPGYLSARRICQSHGAKLIPIPVDASGLVVEQVSASRNPPGVCHAVSPVSDRSHPIVATPLGAADLGATERSVDSRRRLRQRVSLRGPTHSGFARTRSKQFSAVFRHVF